MYRKSSVNIMTYFDPAHVTYSVKLNCKILTIKYRRIVIRSTHSYSDQDCCEWHPFHIYDMLQLDHKRYNYLIFEEYKEIYRYWMNIKTVT